MFEKETKMKINPTKKAKYCNPNIKPLLKAGIKIYKIQLIKTKISVYSLHNYLQRNLFILMVKAINHLFTIQL